MTTFGDVRDALGFQTVKSFQEAWNLDDALVVDGVIGPKTTAAMNESLSRHRAGETDISTHFSASEFHCHCGGKLAGCKLVIIRHELLVNLEKLRAAYGRPVVLLDGYRCPKHNAQVSGSATDSQHMYGNAVDPDDLDMTRDQVRALHLFSGIGSKRANPHLVKHVDVRHADKTHNTTKSTVTSPALWYYA